MLRQQSWFARKVPPSVPLQMRIWFMFERVIKSLLRFDIDRIIEFPFFAKTATPVLCAKLWRKICLHFAWIEWAIIDSLWEFLTRSIPELTFKLSHQQPLKCLRICGNFFYLNLINKILRKSLASASKWFAGIQNLSLRKHFSNIYGHWTLC